MGFAPLSNEIALLAFGVRLLMVHIDTWNDTAIKAAWDEATAAEIKGLMVYAASKAEGERAAFNWVENNKPGFILNSVLPDYTVYLLTPLVAHYLTIARLERFFIPTSAQPGV